MASEQLLKIILEGGSGAGKSRLFERYTNHTFAYPDPCTIGIEFVSLTQSTVRTKVGHQQCKLQVWDRGGLECFRSVLDSYHRKAQGVVLVYSVTERSSFHNLPSWVERLRQVNSDAAMVLVGTKVDLRREVSYCEGVQLAESLGVPFLETSAKTDINVDRTFSLLTRLIGKKLGFFEGLAEPLG